MRNVNLTANTPADPPRLAARKIRHLEARLEELGPGRVRFLRADPGRGLLHLCFPNRSTARILLELGRRGVYGKDLGDETAFCVSAGVSFEDLDYVWACLDGILNGGPNA